MTPSAALLPGNRDLVILKGIALGAHGYDVLLRIEWISGGAMVVPQGADTST